MAQNPVERLENLKPFASWVAIECQFILIYGKETNWACVRENITLVEATILFLLKSIIVSFYSFFNAI